MSCKRLARAIRLMTDKIPARSNQGFLISASEDKEVLWPKKNGEHQESLNCLLLIEEILHQLIGILFLDWYFEGGA